MPPSRRVLGIRRDSKNVITILLFCQSRNTGRELHRGKRAAVSIMRRVCRISPKAGAPFTMSGRDVISKSEKIKEKKKGLQGDFKSLLDESTEKMPILLPITSRADVSELFTHSLEFKEKDYYSSSFFFFAFREALRLSIHQTTLITLVARISCIFFFFFFCQKKISSKPAIPLTCMISEMTDYCWPINSADRPGLTLAGTRATTLKPYRYLKRDAEKYPKMYMN